jgi:hypothetical protein
MATAIAYQLDILGGLQFESLVQELLLAELGLGVELWGGTADHGRDAYCESELNFPNRRVTNGGPFVFQCKFIAGANSAGARFDGDLLAAIRKEAELIKGRISKKKWVSPQHYGFFCNAPISAGKRTKIKGLLRNVLPESTLTIHGATAVCALLDANITVARAFPQLLGLRDLTELLRTVVRNASIQRSESIIREAESLTRVFVPTSSYKEAWQVLAKHNFVVFEGPPEMGKTVLALMIAAVQLTERWEAIDCDRPADFFENYSPSKKQLFLADDAFGTTEYETERGNEWGRHLHKILPMLNSKHWLIWTSRMHILKKALQEMNLQVHASRFPKPAEVIVNASKISWQERALILYRHARVAGLEELAKAIVRKNVANVINNDHFTPERIRRFVNEEIPILAKSANSNIPDWTMSELVEKAIENPTERMKKSYSKLEPRHKWLLAALLDCERKPDGVQLEASYRRFFNPQKPIEEEVQLLEEAFLQKTVDAEKMVIDWIHPSYRDLVIQELQTDEDMALQFLEKCSISGIKLATSVAGGASGEKRLPLMSSKKNWETLRRRLKSLIADSGDEIVSWQVLGMLRNAVKSATASSEEYSQLCSILAECCGVIKDTLDKLGKSIYPFVLGVIYESTMLLNPPPPMPVLYPSLNDVEGRFNYEITRAKEGHFLESDPVADWASVLPIVAKCDQRLLIKSGFPEKHQLQVEELCSLIGGELREHRSYSDNDDLGSDIGRLRELAAALNDLRGLIPKCDTALEQIQVKIESRCQHLAEKQAENDSPIEVSHISQQRQTLDLDRLFSDL